MFMADLPFLSKKNKQGGGGPGTEVVRNTDPDKDTTPDDMLERIAEELMTAIHKKDIKSIREALQAICLNLKD